MGADFPPRAYFGGIFYSISGPLSSKSLFVQRVKMADTHGNVGRISLYFLKKKLHNLKTPTNFWLCFVPDESGQCASLRMSLYVGSFIRKRHHRRRDAGRYHVKLREQCCLNTSLCRRTGWTRHHVHLELEDHVTNQTVLRCHFQDVSGCNTVAGRVFYSVGINSSSAASCQRWWKHSVQHLLRLKRKVLHDVIPL